MEVVMRYNKLGNTGVNVSEIGLGCEHLEGKSAKIIRETFDTAFDLGINIADVFMSEPNVRTDIGAALAGRRDKMILQGHFGAVWQNNQYGRSRDLAVNREFFEDLLTRLNTDYIDIGMLHCIDTDAEFDAVFSGGVADYAQKCKQSGKIRALGISTHDAAIGMRALESGIFDVILFSINPAYDLLPEGLGSTAPLFDAQTYKQPLLGVSPTRDKFYRACESSGVAITVMKALAAGSLLTRERSPFGMALSVNQCLHYALTRPAVSSVMVGVQGAEELAAACSFETATQAQKDFSELLASTPQFSLKGHCMYCNHCLPCPAHINVAQVNKLLDLATAGDKIPASLREHYDALSVHASACISCRACEPRCPFGVQISERMTHAAQIFGK